MKRRSGGAAALAAILAAHPGPSAAQEAPAQAPPPAARKAEAPGRLHHPPACRVDHKAHVNPPAAAPRRAAGWARPGGRSSGWARPGGNVPVSPGMPPALAQMFSRMSQAMGANPANAFQTFVQDLSGLEEESLRKVRLDAREEREIGRKALMEYLERADQAGHEEVADEAKLKYLKSLVATFAAHMRNGARYPEIEVRLIDAPLADGQCFPGGFLVFTTGLLEEPDEATVAGFVAHELAHLDRGHVYQYARRTKLAQTAFRPGPNADFNAFFTDGMAMMGIMMNPYRPDHEHEADCEAVSWLYQEGYDPRALSGFFARLAERQRERPNDGAMPFGMLRRSHPYSLERERHTQDRLRQLERWKPRDDLGLYAENLRALRPKAAGALAAPPAAVVPAPPPLIAEPKGAAGEEEGPGVIVAPRPRGPGR